MTQAGPAVKCRALMFFSLCLVWFYLILKKITLSKSGVYKKLIISLLSCLFQGLIKIRGDKCWRDLTCMDYHYEVCFMCVLCLCIYSTQCVSVCSFLLHRSLCTVCHATELYSLYITIPQVLLSTYKLIKPTNVFISC